MQVVTRREALAVRRARERLLGLARRRQVDPHRRARLRATGPDRRLLERRDQVADDARAAAGLKPEERLALVLQAHGYSYAEIRRLCGWTYTKVNRALAEGRAKLRALRAIS